jgi:GntR family transcriptional regulator
MATVRRLASGIAYQSLAQLLRDDIARGEFSDGRRLPTEAQLTAEYGVSRQTVRRALEELAAEGLIFRVRGRGTFTTPLASGRYLRSIGSVEDLLSLSVDSVMETVRPLQRRADVVAAGRLRADSDQVIGGLFRRLHEGVPFSITEVWLPLTVGRRIVESGALQTPGEIDHSTVIGLLDEVNGEPIAGAHQSITASGAPPELAELIDRRPDDHVLRVDRLYFNPERYSYRLDLRRRIRPGEAGRT